MSRNGSGTYAPNAPDFPVVDNTTITASAWNNTVNDISAAITASIANDGQTPIAANIPMAGHKFTGLGVGSSAGDSVEFSQLGPFYLYVRDEKSQGTNAGASAATSTQFRTLNTVVTNTISGASLASDTITLPAGTYQIKCSIPGYLCGKHKASLFNNTDSAYTLVGSSSYGGSAGDPPMSFSYITGQFTITGSKNFKIIQYTEIATAIDGLGVATNQSSVGEVYTQVEIWKMP